MQIMSKYKSHVYFYDSRTQNIFSAAPRGFYYLLAYVSMNT